MKNPVGGGNAQICMPTANKPDKKKKKNVSLSLAASEIQKGPLLPTPYIRDPDVVDYSSELKSKFRTILESPSNCVIAVAQFKHQLAFGAINN